MSHIDSTARISRPAPAATTSTLLGGQDLAAIVAQGTNRSEILNAEGQMRLSVAVESMLIRADRSSPLPRDVDALAQRIAQAGPQGFRLAADRTGESGFERLTTLLAMDGPPEHRQHRDAALAVVAQSFSAVNSARIARGEPPHRLTPQNTDRLLAYQPIGPTSLLRNA